jgi:hypothetical protein
MLDLHSPMLDGRDRDVAAGGGNRSRRGLRRNRDWDEDDRERKSKPFHQNLLESDNFGAKSRRNSGQSRLSAAMRSILVARCAGR